MQRYVTRRLGSDAADDVVADTFLLAFRQRGSYDPTRANALPWLYGIATNLIGRHRRNEVRLDRALARAGADPVTTPLATAPFTDQVDGAITAGMAGRHLERISDSSRAAEVGTGRNSTCVLYTTDIDMTVRALTRNGVPTDPVADRPYGRETVFRDLYGNPYALVEPR